MSEEKTSMAEQLDAALSALYPGAVFPMLYTGPLLRYVVWNYDILPAVFAERAPHAARYLVQVHLYLPHKENPNTLKIAIISACVVGGFTFPSMTNASDKEGQHYVFEFEYANGGGYYGQT